MRTSLRQTAGRALCGLLLLLPAAMAAPLQAHPGGLDEYGGHFDEKTTVYHYHRPKAEMARRKKEHLAWIEPGKMGELQGRVVKVERPDAIWVEISYRPAYQELARILPPSLRDDGQKRVLVWFRYVSPEASAVGGKQYKDWFGKKVMYEVERKARGKEVKIQFRIPDGGRRLYGMVFLGEENLNLWLVLGGWSYYLLSQGENPNEDQFKQAEKLAQRRMVGLWNKGG